MLRDTVCDCPYTYAGGTCINSIDPNCRECPVYRDWLGHGNHMH